MKSTHKCDIIKNYNKRRGGGGDPMYHVAICDDDKVFISYIKKILNQAKGNKQYQFKIFEFCSGEEL